MVIQKNSKKGNIIRYNKYNQNNRITNMYGGGPIPVLQTYDVITIHNTGYVFVSTPLNHCILVFTPNPDYIHIYTIGSQGISGISNSRFNHPKGISIHNDILYVADTYNHRIQVFRININEADNTITATHLPSELGNQHSIGIGAPGIQNNQFNSPHAVVIHNNILYVADSMNHRIQVFRININDVDNTINALHISRQLGGNPHSIGISNRGNENNRFYHPSGLAINNNILYVADTYNNRIQVFRIIINANNTITAVHIPRELGGNPNSIGTGVRGNAESQFAGPCCLAIHQDDEHNDILYVSDSDNRRVQIFRITINHDSTITATHLPGRNGSPASIGTRVIGNINYSFSTTNGIAIDRLGDENILYVADKYNYRIQIFNGDITNPATLQYYDTIQQSSPIYTIINQIRMMPLDVRNTLCMFCNFSLCTPNPNNRNSNVNGYIISIEPNNPRYCHYTCIYNYIMSHSRVDIDQFGINRYDTNSLIIHSRDNNNFEGTNFFAPDFIMLNRETDVPANIRGTPCRLCGFPLCARVIDTYNNLNGYVVYLHNITQPNTFYYHYKCIFRYFIQIMLSASPYKSPHCATVLEKDDINMLLNIDEKADAVIGNGFYTD